MLDSKQTLPLIQSIQYELDLDEENVNINPTNPTHLQEFIEKISNHPNINKTVKKDIETLNQIIQANKANKPNITKEQITHIYNQLKDRKIHPKGHFDKQGRFYLEDQELVDVSKPSIKYPYTQMKAGRTLKYVKAIVEKYKPQNETELLSLFTMNTGINQ